MKRIVLIALALVFTGAAFAAAQSTTPGTPTLTSPRVGQAFVDANGDGICDNFQNGTPRGPRAGAGGGRRGYGPGDGTGNQGMGPRDGTGYGPGGASGNCDGTGPKGQRRGRR
jgi:hypothetical protein